MRALGFEPKKEEIKKMIADIDKDGSVTCRSGYDFFSTVDSDIMGESHWPIVCLSLLRHIGEKWC